MTERRRPFPLLMAEMLRDGVPRTVESVERIHSDSGQAVVWLVGIASTLLVLAVGSPEKVVTAVGASYGWLCTLLLLTILFGVLCRLLSLYALALLRQGLLALGSSLAGYVAGASAHTPAILSDGWDEEEIVGRLQSEFGRDYRFLLQYRVPLAGCREAYSRAYADDEADVQKQFAHLCDVVAAHAGLRDGDELRQKVMSNDDARRRARRAKWIAIGASVCALLGSSAFVAAMALIAWGVSHAPR